MRCWEDLAGHRASIHRRRARAASFLTAHRKLCKQNRRGNKPPSSRCSASAKRLPSVSIDAKLARAKKIVADVCWLNRLRFIDSGLRAAPLLLPLSLHR